MAHVFISYSSEHRKYTEELAAYLEGHGLDVWWDQELASRTTFDEQIQEELRSAGCVVVIWTEGAVESEWVHKEVRHAVAHDQLIAVREDDLQPEHIPEEFRKHDAHKFYADRDLILRDVLAIRQGRLLLEAKVDPLPPSDYRKPTDLLQARYGVVDLVGADDQLRDLINWATGEGPYASHNRAAAGRLIHGPGGRGKTRLLIEAAAYMRENGWSAGFIARPPADGDKETRARYDKAIGYLIRGASDRGLFLVMDYAEGREDDLQRLTDKIRARPADDHRPVRLVLLSRAAGDWWQRAIGHDATQALFGAGHGDGDVQALEGMRSHQTRMALFEKAVQAFAPVLQEDGYDMPTRGPDPKRLEMIRQGDGYDRPLAIQMEALLHLAGSAPSERGVAALLDRIIDLERQHWPKLVGKLDGQEGRVTQDHLERAVGQVTGVQGVSSQRAMEDLLMADARYPDRDSNRGKVEVLTNTITRIYGRLDGGVAHLEPDLIGEHLVAGIADKELIDGCVAWIERAPDAEREDLRETLLTVLQRASQDVHGPIARKAIDVINQLIDDHGADFAGASVNVMSSTPGALFSCLESKVDTLSPVAVYAIAAALPVQIQPRWLEFALKVAERHVSTARQVVVADPKSDERKAMLAAALGELSIRYGNLKRREEALAASEESVSIRQELYDKHPEVHVELLAKSLNNISVDYSNLKRREEALAASEESVSIRRKLYDKQPDVYAEDLASSLNNISVRYSDLKRFEDALVASEEAVSIRRELYDKHPEVHVELLATSLNNISVDYSNLKRREEALAASEEAVSIRRKLYDKHPEVYAEGLATSLNNLGVRYIKMERFDDAFTASDEAASIFQKLYDKHPEVYAEVLARSLSVLSDVLRALQRPADGAAATREGLVILLPVLEQRPKVYGDLARMLGREHIEASNEAGQDPDIELLKRVADVLADDTPNDDPSI